MTHLSKKTMTEIWNNIAKIKNDLQNDGLDFEDFLKLTTHFWDKTSFWHERWLGNQVLRLSYPSLYTIE